MPPPIILWYHTSPHAGSRRARVKLTERIGVGAVDGKIVNRPSTANFRFKLIASRVFTFTILTLTEM